MVVFKRKTRTQIVDEKIESIMHDVLTLDFSSEELAYIINGLLDRSQSVLERKAERLEIELSNTVAALANLKNE